MSFPGPWKKMFKFQEFSWNSRSSANPAIKKYDKKSQVWMEVPLFHNSSYLASISFDLKVAIHCAVFWWRPISMKVLEDKELKSGKSFNFQFVRVWQFSVEWFARYCRLKFNFRIHSFLILGSFSIRDAFQIFANHSFGGFLFLWPVFGFL